MSLKSCTEIYDRQSSINENGETAYQRLFQVVTTDPKDGAYLARIAPGIGIGDQYTTTTEYDTNAFCTGVTTRCTAEDGKTWKQRSITALSPRLNRIRSTNPTKLVGVLPNSSEKSNRTSTERPSPIVRATRFSID
jgi:hypothetical protein